jgi:hypothetical protein
MSTTLPRCFREVQEREHTILGQLAQRFRLADLETTARTLKAARELLEQVSDGHGEGE